MSALQPVEPGGAPPLRREDASGDLAVLTSKLAPPTLTSAVIKRTRLLTVLARGVRRTPVTLISGQAGAGKTMLAASWFEEQPTNGSSAWLTMDRYDEDPGTFWAYVREALVGAGADLAGVDKPVPGELLPSSFVPALAVAVLTLPRPVTLVIDNADHLVSRDVTAGLDLLARHASSRLRLVLCARADPPLPLHQYRLTDALTEIRGAQLAFTTEETTEMLARLRVHISAEGAEALRAGTEGWAVGLRLAAAPLKQGGDLAGGKAAQQLVASLATDDGSVAQYLVAEVLDDLPAPVRRLLLRTSVTVELDPDLVDRLAGRKGGHHVLAALAQANAFVERAPGGSIGYRVHPLLRELLQAQLSYDSPGAVAQLHHICATWYAERGRVQEAVSHAIAAGDWELATDLLIDDLVVSRLLIHEFDPSLAAVDALPSDLTGAGAAVARTAVSFAQRRAPAPADLPVVAAVAADATNRLALRVSAAVTAVAAAAGGGVSDDEVLRAADDAAELVASLPDEHRRARRELSAVVTVARATVLLRGDAEDVDLLDVLQAALAASEAVGSHRLRSLCLGELALMEGLQGHLRRSTELVGRAERLSAVRQPAEAVAAAWACVERNEPSDARRWILQAHEAGPDSSVCGPLLAVLQSRLLRLRHEVEPAERALHPYVGAGHLPRWVREQVVSEQVRVAFAGNQRQRGLLLLDRLQQGSPRRPLLQALAGVLEGSGGPLGALLPEGAALPLTGAVEAEVVRTCIRADEGDVPSAVAALERGLRLAAPECLRWPFLDSPAQIRRLLRVHPRLSAAGGWLSASGAATLPASRGPDGQETEPEAVLTQQLSDRELEVLHHLAEMLSTPEIAAAMFISVNTVRTHIRSILRKLAVNRRNQAVRRGRDLGLI
jgi:LuxR family maltose regulon positive regulatory protein